MPQNPRRSWKRPLTTALKITFSGVLLAWVLHKTDLASIWQSLASASPAWLVLALAMGIAGTMVQAKQWQRLLGAVGLDRSITRSLRIVFVGNTFNAIMPSSIGGDASRAVYIAERPGERAPGAAARVRPVALVGALIGLTIVGITLSPLIGRLAASTMLARVPGWRPVATSLQVLDGFRSQRAELVAAAGRGAVFWSFTVLNQWAYIRAVGIHPSLGYAALVVTLVNLISMLPLSINGFGARETGYIALLAGVGLATTAQAASVGLLISAQSLLFGLIGAGCLLTLRSAAPWARRVDAATMAVVTGLYATAGWLSTRRLLMTLGIGRRPPKHAVARSAADTKPADRGRRTGHGAQAYHRRPQAQWAGAGHAKRSSAPDRARR